MKLTVVAKISGSSQLAATSPQIGDVLELDEAHTVDELGTVHRVRGRPWLLTRPLLDEVSDTMLRGLVRLHGQLAAHGSVEGLHAAFWYGTVQRADRSTERVVVTTDLPAHGIRTLGETRIPDVALHVRICLAASLAATMTTIAGLPAVLGRLDSGSVHLDLIGKRALVGGLETGSFGRHLQELVLDVGAAEGQLAPELYDGDGIYAQDAGAATDAWALAVLLHRILFGCHPYHFLADLSPSTVGDYLSTHEWPAGGTGVDFDGVYRALPVSVTGLFHRVFQSGWSNPGARPSAEEWSAAIGPWMGTPEFSSLTVDRTVIVVGEAVTVTWATRHATHVATVSGQPLDAVGKAEVWPSSTGALELWAVGPTESVRAATPAILVLRNRPTPDVRPIDRPEPVVAAPAPVRSRLSVQGGLSALRMPIRSIAAPRSTPVRPGVPRFTVRPSRFEDPGES